MDVDGMPLYHVGMHLPLEWRGPLFKATKLAGQWGSFRFRCASGQKYVVRVPSTKYATARLVGSVDRTIGMAIDHPYMGFIILDLRVEKVRPEAGGPSCPSVIGRSRSSCARRVLMEKKKYEQEKTITINIFSPELFPFSSAERMFPRICIWRR